MSRTFRPSPVLLALSLAACAANPPRTDPAAAAASAEPAPPPAPNTLTKAEADAGWRLLFDGRTTAGWRGFKQSGFPPSGWTVEDGELRCAPNGGKPSGGDIVTEEEFDDFELQLEWKLLAGGNSGLKYLVDENLVKEGTWGVGFEMQIADRTGKVPATTGKHDVAGLYDLHAPLRYAAREAGQWNEARLVVRGAHVEHWLNGEKQVSFERWSPELRALIAVSKFKNTAGFGENRRGRLLLQDHGEWAAFRNIKLRRLDGSPVAARR